MGPRGHAGERRASRALGLREGQGDWARTLVAGRRVEREPGPASLTNCANRSSAHDLWMATPFRMNLSAFSTSLRLSSTYEGRRGGARWARGCVTWAPARTALATFPPALGGAHASLSAQTTCVRQNYRRSRAMLR